MENFTLQSGQLPIVRTEYATLRHVPIFWIKLAGILVSLQALDYFGLLRDWRAWSAIAAYRIFCTIRDRSNK